MPFKGWKGLSFIACMGFLLGCGGGGSSSSGSTSSSQTSSGTELKAVFACCPLQVGTLDFVIQVPNIGNMAGSVVADGTMKTNGVSYPITGTYDNYNLNIGNESLTFTSNYGTSGFSLIGPVTGPTVVSGEFYPVQVTGHMAEGNITLSLYEGDISSNGMTGKVILLLANDNSLRGALATATGSSAAISGSISGNTITATASGNGNPVLTAAFSGTVSGTSIPCSGTINNSPVSFTVNAASF